MFENHRKSLSQHCERNEHFWRVFENMKLPVSVTRHLKFNRTKNGVKCQTIQMRHFDYFSNNVSSV